MASMDLFQGILTDIFFQIFICKSRLKWKYSFSDKCIWGGVFILYENGVEYNISKPQGCLMLFTQQLNINHECLYYSRPSVPMITSTKLQSLNKEFNFDILLV